MEKTAGELNRELQSLLQSIVDQGDRAMKTFRSLRELKLRSVPFQVPDEFKCPLSGKPMSDPVVVASGQTYDRDAIKGWLEKGNHSCPKTKQNLSHIFLTPNVLVKEMILKWRKENAISSDAEKQVLLRLLTKLSSSSVHDQKMAAKEIRERASLLGIKEIRSLFGLQIPDAISQIIQALSSNNDVHVEEDLISALLTISLDESNKKLFAETNGAIPAIINSLKSQSVVTRSTAAGALYSLAELESNKLAIGESGGLKLLIKLVDEAHAEVIQDAAKTLVRLCFSFENRSRAVADGAVPVIIQKIRDETLVDELLSVLELLCSIEDGVKEMVEADAVSLLLGIMRKGADEANKEKAIYTLCSICSADERQLKNVDKEEIEHGTVFQLALHGTLRAHREEANALLKKLNALA